jgi:hypothetical protein
LKRQSSRRHCLEVAEARPQVVRFVFSHQPRRARRCAVSPHDEKTRLLFAVAGSLPPRPCLSEPQILDQNADGTRQTVPFLFLLMVQTRKDQTGNVG